MRLDTFGQRIFSVRQHWHWSQKKLAECIYSSQEIISVWENEINIPSNPVVVSLAALFGCTFKELKTGIGFKLPNEPQKLSCFNIK